MRKIFFLTFLFILIPFLSGANTASACEISSATFDPSGDQVDSWYRDGKTRVNINIKSVNCAGKNISFSLFERDAVDDNVLDDSGLENTSITVPSDNFDLFFLAGEEECEGVTALGAGYDCNYYFVIKTDSMTYKSRDNAGGKLRYECETLCSENWRLLDVIKDGDIASIDALKNIRDDSYTLLAPIGSLKKIDKSFSIGDYLNEIFKISIGLAGALAVVIIVIQGVLYMGSESVFGKTKAKERIMMAIGGLVLALGSFVLLNTINPDLIGNGISIKSVSIDPSKPVSDETEYDTAGSSGSAGTGSCSSLKKNPGRFNSTAEKKSAEDATEKAGGLTDLRKVGFNVKNNGLVQKTLAEKLLYVNKNLGIGYSITEAFKATTYAHVSKCHYLASCVDLAFRKNGAPTIATAEEVKKAIQVFRQAGLFAQFEVGSTKRYNELGITKGELSEGDCPNVITVKGVAEHFSVYLK